MDQKQRRAQRLEDQRRARFNSKLAAWQAEVTRLEEEVLAKEEEERKKALKEGRMVRGWCGDDVHATLGFFVVCMVARSCRAASSAV